MKDVICFGDYVLSLCPEGYYRFLQVNRAEMFYTGAEANVAASLAQFGMRTQLVTRLPENIIGEAALASMRKYGIGTDFVVRGGDRIGVIYTERGASQRPSTVVYDRAHDAFSDAPADCYDWNAALSNADWFHFTGITPALSENASEITETACKAAKSKGLTVSCDLNYRSKMWSPEKAGSVMRRLLPYVDVLIANEWDVEKLFGIHAHYTRADGQVDREGFARFGQQVEQAFGIGCVCSTFRNSISASVNDWSAMLYRGGKTCFSKTYTIQIVNRVGGGDSFDAGLIYGVKSGMIDQDALEFATAASCLKHSIEMDFNLVSVGDVMNLVNGDGSGRIQR